MNDLYKRHVVQIPEFSVTYYGRCYVAETTDSQVLNWAKISLILARQR